MGEVTDAGTAAHSSSASHAGMPIALCRLPAVMGSAGFLLVLLVPLGRWEPVVMLAWFGTGLTLCFRGVERHALRWFGRMRPCQGVVRDALAGPWTAACAAAGMPPTEVDLYVRLDGEINAFAVGRRAVCVTSASVSELVARRITDDQVTALLLREIGHLRHGDTRFMLALAWLSAPWRVVCRIALYACATIAGPQPRTLLAAVALAAGVVAVVHATEAGNDPVAVVLLALLVSAVVVPALGAHFARRREYAADRFVVDRGYGSDLATLLTQIDSTSETSGLRAISCRHPTTARRCWRLSAPQKIR